MKSIFIIVMDNLDIKEVKDILGRHEELTQDNSKGIMLISVKLKELE